MAVVGVERQARGQPFGAESHGAVAGGRNGEEEGMAGADAKDFCAVDARRGRRFGGEDDGLFGAGRSGGGLLGREKRG